MKRFQRSAVAERRTADMSDVLRNGDCRQAGAVGKSGIANAGDALRNGDALQVLAVVERIVCDLRDTLRNNHFRQTGAAVESLIPNGSDLAGHGAALQAGAVGKGKSADLGDAVRDVHRFQGVAVIERCAVNDFQSGRQLDLFQRGTAQEKAGIGIIVRIILRRQRRDALRDRNGFQSGTAVENRLAHRSHLRRKRNCRQLGTGEKCAVAHPGDAVRQL